MEDEYEEIDDCLQIYTSVFIVMENSFERNDNQRHTSRRHSNLI